MKRLFSCLALSLLLISCSQGTERYHPGIFTLEDKPGIWNSNPGYYEYRNIQRDHALLYKKLEDIEHRLILLQQNRNKLDVTPP
jgi:hypothetical protein